MARINPRLVLLVFIIELVLVLIFVFIIILFVFVLLVFSVLIVIHKNHPAFSAIISKSGVIIHFEIIKNK